MAAFRNVILALFIGLLLISSCSTRRNTFMTRQYHNFTTYFNVYFNGKESLKEGEEKIVANHREQYSYLLPIFISDNDVARRTAYSNMDRAAIKGQKAIKLHSITRKPRRRSNRNYKYYKKQRNKKEYNRFVDDCYLLIAKGNFYNKKYNKADKTFAFIIRNFEGEPIVVDARLWYARSLVEQSKFAKAKQQLSALSSKINLIPSSSKEMYYKVYADMYIKSGDISSAIKSVEKLINVVSGRKEKIRYRYILAQLFLNEGMEDAALSHFRSISRMRVSYEMAFNASISMAMAYNGSNGGGLRRMLNKMLRDDRNVNLKDQIYYALGYIESKDGNLDKSVDYMKKSARYSVDNDVQKSLSYKSLGDYYYKNKNYINAYNCYDSCVYLSGAIVNIDKEILIRRNNLSDLVRNLNEINRQDSLQRLADMSAKQRNKIIQDKIDIILKEEEALRQSQKDAQLDRSFYLENRSSGVNNYRDNKGGWYFYNPVAISMGRSEFIRKWGKRRSEDNWRRKNKAVVEMTNLEDVEAVEDLSGEPELNGGRKNKEFYLRNIPLSPERRKASDLLVVESLYDAAGLLDEKLGDKEEALRYYEQLIKRYPDNKYILYSYFNAYKLCGETAKYSKQDYYKTRIVKEFPKSRYAYLLKNPDYMQKHISDIETVDALYETAYKEYSNYSFVRAISFIDKALSVYPKNEIVDKMLMLKALCVGRLYSKSTFINALKEVLKANPGEEIRIMAQRLLSSMDKGAVPVNYESGDVEYARSLKKNREWYFKSRSGKSAALKTTLYRNERKGRFIVVFSIDSKAKNINRLNYHVNYIAEDIIDHAGISIDRKQIGVENSLLVIKGLKDVDEAKQLYIALAESKRIRILSGSNTYSVFYISEGNYSVLEYNQDIAAYEDFFVKNYLVNGISESNVTDKKLAKTVFNMDMSSNHKFVVLFSAKDMKTNDVINVLEDYDADFSPVVDMFSDDYDVVVVDNIGNKADALEYFNGFKDYLKENNIDRLKKCRMIAISDENYDLLYANKNIKEYCAFFERNYKSGKVKKKEEELLSRGDFVFNDKVKHSFVLVFSSEIETNRLIRGFRKYNSEGLDVRCVDFVKGKKMIIVTNMSNKKQAMMYFRAVVTNRNLFKPLKSSVYRNFVISEDNLKVLRKNHQLDEYVECFKKWYLNR